MTPRELEILNTIYQSGGQCSVPTVGKKTALSPEYIRLISKELLKQKLVKKIGNNILVLTSSGRSFVEWRCGSQGSKKMLTLAEVAHSFGKEVQSPLVKAEIAFVNEKFTVEQPRLIEYNLGKDLIIEVANGESIQTNIKRLTSVERK
jgi:hypothetical protein